MTTRPEASSTRDHDSQFRLQSEAVHVRAGELGSPRRSSGRSGRGIAVWVGSNVVAGAGRSLERIGLGISAEGRFPCRRR
jgi:hypothetical protein